MLGVDSVHVRARRTLIGTLKHLEGYRRDAIVVVGAQAVYLRTETGASLFAPLTKDADLAVDPRILELEPPLGKTLARLGYTHRDEQPGLYWAPGSGHEDGDQIDILVPEEFAAGAGRRDANLPGDNRGVARRTPGLESSLYDRDIRCVTDLGESGLAVEAFVAGPAALIIAKAQTIADRVSKSPERIKVKDVTDVFALLRTHETAELRERFRALSEVQEIRGAFMAGISAIREIFGGRRGRALFGEAVDAAGERPELLGDYDALTAELSAILEEIGRRL